MRATVPVLLLLALVSGGVWLLRDRIMAPPQAGRLSPLQGDTRVAPSPRPEAAPRRPAPPTRSPEPAIIGTDPPSAPTIEPPALARTDPPPAPTVGPPVLARTDPSLAPTVEPPVLARTDPLPEPTVEDPALGTTPPEAASRAVPVASGEPVPLPDLAPPQADPEAALALPRVETAPIAPLGPAGTTRVLPLPGESLVPIPLDPRPGITLPRPPPEVATSSPDPLTRAETSLGSPAGTQPAPTGSLALPGRRVHPEPSPLPPALEPLPPPAPASAPEAVRKEAELFVARLIAPEPRPVPIERADHFVSPDQALSLVPVELIELTTPRGLAERVALDTPITLVHEVEQLETVTPEKLIEDSGGDLEQRIRVVAGAQVEEISVRDALGRYAAGEPVPVLRMVRHYELSTPRELGEEGRIGADERISVITAPYRLATATVAELMAETRATEPDAVFYIRTVRETDRRGLWGIIQEGLTDNFARGVAIRRGEEVDVYRVLIPPDADELLADQSSSFLGRMIHRKSIDSHVYNFKENRMGRNPDLLRPGQEIIIVHFSPAELIAIYRHFVEQQGREGAAADAGPRQHPAGLSPLSRDSRPG